MPVTINSGLVATDDPLAADLKVSMADKVAYLDSDTSQFTTMLMKLPVATAKSFKEEWENNEFIPRNTALAASAASGDTTLTVTTNEGSYAKVGDIGKFVQTGEAFRITTVGASAWTVVRAIGSVTAASAASGTANGGIIIIAGSNEQGGTLPTAQVPQLTSDYNYCQIVRDSWRYTNTAGWTQFYSGDLVANARRDTGVQHKRQLEQIMFDGARSYTAGTNAPRCTAGGLLQYLSTNTTSAGGTFDKGEIQDVLKTVVEYGNKARKVLFASPVLAMVLSEFLQDNWVQARPEDNVWGVKVDAIISGVTGSKVPVFTKTEWKRFGEGTGNHIGSRGIFVDMDYVRLKRAPDYRGPRYMGLYSKRQAPDADEIAEEYLSELTLIVQQERSHTLLTGVTG